MILSTNLHHSHLLNDIVIIQIRQQFRLDECDSYFYDKSPHKINFLPKALCIKTKGLS